MAAVRSRGNSTTELALARLLRAARRTGWRRHTSLLGRPDFVFRREKVAIFTDGCFWHGCPRCWTKPQTAFWALKVDRNRARDRRVSRELRAFGWSVCRLWEHELHAEDVVVRKIKCRLRRRTSVAGKKGSTSSGAPEYVSRG
jgi:DNA mismatch endonuclease (patch repair protein)